MTARNRWFGSHGSGETEWFRKPWNSEIPEAVQETTEVEEPEAVQEVTEQIYSEEEARITGIS